MVSRALQVFKRCVEEYSPNDPNEDFVEGFSPYFGLDVGETKECTMYDL